MINYTSIKNALVNIIFDLPETDYNELKIMTMAEEVVTALPTRENKTVTVVEIPIIEHKGRLPIHKTIESIYYKEPNGEMWYRLALSSGNIESSVVCADCPQEYSLDGLCNITTTFKNGTIKVTYRSIPLDEEGNLMMPDVPALKSAIYHYIMYRYFSGLCLKADADQYRLYKLEREFHLSMYNTYFTKSVGEINRPSEDQMENMNKFHNSYVNYNRSWNNGFSNLNKSNNPYKI